MNVYHRHKCIMNECELGAAVHEIFHGSLYRRLAIKYKLQAPLCPYHHAMAHGRRTGLSGRKNSVDTQSLHGESFDVIDPGWGQEDWQRQLCDMVGIDFEKTKLALNRYNVDEMAVRFLEVQRKLTVVK